MRRVSHEAMFSITPDPIAFTLGPVAVHWYGLFAAVSFLLAWHFIPRFARQFNLSRSAVEDAMLFAVLLGILFARLMHVMLEWEYYATHPQLIIAVWHGGLAAFGGLLGGLLGVWIAARKHKVDWLRLADLLAPWVFLAFAIGRIANVLNGEILGTPCNCSFAFIFPDGIPRHPVQVYSLALNAFTFFLGLFLLRKRFAPGVVLLGTLLSYATLRFIVEFFRLEPRVLLSLDAAQLALLITIPLLTFFLIKTSRKDTRSAHAQSSTHSPRKD